MKKIIFIMVITMIAFASESVNAQSVVTVINTRDAQACGEYLVKNPQDTIVNESNINKDGMRGVVKRSVYMQNNRLVAWNDTVFLRAETRETVNSDLVKDVDRKSTESRFVEELSKGQPRDIIFANSSDVKAYRDGKNGDTSDKDAGKVVLKAANKYGWSVAAHAGYSFANGVSGPIAGAGVSYDRRWWGLYLNGEAGKSKYSSNAVSAGKDYWIFRAESALMLRPFQLDEYDQNRLFVLGGVGFEHYKTDSQPYQTVDGKYGYLASTGNYLYATFGAAFEHRFFATGNVIGARLQWRNTRAAVQNNGDENFGSIALSLYFKFGFYRNKVVAK